MDFQFLAEGEAGKGIFRHAVDIKDGTFDISVFSIRDRNFCFCAGTPQRANKGGEGEGGE